MIVIGLMGLIQGDYAPIWQQVPENLAASKWLACLCAVVSLGCGLGLLWRRTAAPAARVLFVFLFLWIPMAAFEIPLGIWLLAKGARAPAGRSWGQS